MAKDKAPDPLDRLLDGTERLMVGFADRTATFAAEDGVNVGSLVSRVISASFKLLRKAIRAGLTGVGAVGDEVEEILDALGADELVEGLNKALAEATSPADVAAVGTLLPLVKKILRFIVETFKVQLTFDLDKVLEFIDELATTAMDQVSPKGAEAMHRSEVRFLEAQYHLDRLAGLKELPGPANGR